MREGEGCQVSGCPLLFGVLYYFASFIISFIISSGCPLLFLLFLSFIIFYF